MIPKAFVLYLFLVSPLNGLILLSLDLCLTYMSANSSSFLQPLKNPQLSFSKGTANLQSIPMAEASCTKRDFRTLRSHASHSAILLPSATVPFRTARCPDEVSVLGSLRGACSSARGLGWTICRVRCVQHFLTSAEPSWFLRYGQTGVGSALSLGGQAL